MTKPKSVTETKPKHKASLSDLNDDPSLINDLSKADVIRLHNEAEKSDITLGGNTRGLLNQLFNVHSGSEGN